MWLINAETYRLHSFKEGNVPPYAILTHCWADGEVSFAYFREAQIVEDGARLSMEEEEEAFPMFRQLRELKLNKLKSMKGWEKVDRLCKKSSAYGLKWAWIDTACIDKSSSAELQEAINSMYKWYQDAEKCFVYMKDVLVASLNGSTVAKDQFKKSRWFCRGWTLQELIAPNFERLIFLNRDWKFIEAGADLMSEVATLTATRRLVLSERSVKTRKLLIFGCSVAERMSWASQRQVGRVKDAAYCLLGLFGVDMPMLYGEGKHKLLKGCNWKFSR